MLRVFKFLENARSIIFIIINSTSGIDKIFFGMMYLFNYEKPLNTFILEW